MAMTVEEFRKKVAEDAAKPRPVPPDEPDDWGPEIDKYPIHNPARRK